MLMGGWRMRMRKHEARVRLADPVGVRMAPAKLRLLSVAEAARIASSWVCELRLRRG